MRRALIVVIAVVLMLAFTTTAFAATYSINWSLNGWEEKHGVNRYSMTSTSIISHEQFLRSPSWKPLGIGVYCHDDGQYYIKKLYTNGIIPAGTFYGVDGLCSFAVYNGATSACTASGVYSY